MNTQTTALPKLFIGMDVHKKSWTLQLRTDLFDYKTLTMPPSCDSLASYVQKNFPDHEVTCCYEAGCCGYWIARSLQSFGWKVLVVNPADVPRTDKQGWQKTDKITAAIFANNWSPTTSKPSLYLPKNRSNFEVCFAAAFILHNICEWSKIILKVNCSTMGSKFRSSMTIQAGAGIWKIGSNQWTGDSQLLQQPCEAV